MEKELYYQKQDAIATALAFAQKCGGVTVNASADDRTKFDYKDRDALDTAWSGETPAVLVSGQIDGKEVAGLYAWLSEEDKATDDWTKKLHGAICTFNADPFLIEDDKTALDAARTIAKKDVDELYDCDDDWDECLAKLDLTEDNKVEKIYTFDGGCFCLAEDWTKR